MAGDDDVDTKYQSNKTYPAKGKKKNKPKKIPLSLAFPDTNEEQPDILSAYYASKLPAPEDLGLQSEEFPALSTEQKETLKVTADQLINQAFNGLETQNRMQHLLLRCEDILSLQAGGNPACTFQEKFKKYGTVENMKVFPRHTAVAVTFATWQQCEKAKVDMHNHVLLCHKMSCNYLQAFPTKEAIREFLKKKPLPAPPVKPVRQAAAVFAPVPQPPAAASASDFDEADQYLDFLLDA